ncbi:hypothetical protein [Rhodopila sp.]|uniref:hypothetical protein n=1 Tax=Rhodopila sp. TaxID=2480087 RepID=UPI003D13446A
MHLHAPRRAALLVLPLLLSACGWFGQAHTVRRLDDRLQQRLASDIASGNAALQPIPDGARVTLLGPSSFPVDEQALDDQRRDVRASVIEGLLDPSLMRIQLADTSALPAYQRDLRVRNMAQYLQLNGLGSTLQPAPMPQTAPPGSPPGLVIDVTLQCPPNRGGAGYGDGKSKPICD